MFGGIVETVGTVIHLSSENSCKHFSISPQKKFNDLTIGDSISINGVCLTVTSIHNNDFNVTAVPETLGRTNLNALRNGNLVNLERALQVGERLGGHFIQGHVDAMGEILALKTVDSPQVYLAQIRTPHQLNKYIIPKGFISLDGMSITVIDTQKEQSTFTVTLIPHTQAVTIAKNYQVGSKINIEVDMMGKYIQRILEEHIHANSN
jgi:riboflavin synthase